MTDDQQFNTVLALLRAYRRPDLALDQHTTTLLEADTTSVAEAINYLVDIGLLTNTSPHHNTTSRSTDQGKQHQADEHTASHSAHPTTAHLKNHYEGPAIAVIDITHSGWRLAISGMDALPTLTHIDELTDSPSHLVEKLTAHLDRLHDELNRQLSAIVIATPSTVTSEGIAHTMIPGFEQVDFQPLIRHFCEVPVLLENKATLAGHLEAELVRFDNPESKVVVYLDLGSNVTGSFIVNGETISGATGTAGEFGHVPYGDSRTPCACGARGCWGTAISGIGLAELLGTAPPADPESYLRQAIKDSWYESQNYVMAHNHTPTDSSQDHSMDAARALQELGRRFARGISGLTNALAPDTIILAGLGPQLQRATTTAFNQTYASALMAARRDSPSEIRYAQAGPDAVLRGAALYVLDSIVTAQFITKWQDS